MIQMEIRLKPNYFRVNWNRREIRQKIEEHKVKLVNYFVFSFKIKNLKVLYCIILILYKFQY